MSIHSFFSFKKLLTYFGIASSAFAFSQAKPMQVLFIGNSYTHMNSMPKMFESIARSKGIKIDVTMSAKSNHTFKMHCQRPELFEDIKSQKWDYVVMQGFSRELSYEPEYMDTATIPYFKQILDSIYANKACTNVLLYMTWGYKNGSTIREEVNTYAKMSERIEKGYTYLSKMFNLPIVPVGNVWKNVRELDPNINLYREDEQHPTPYGSYLIASTFYSSIFKASPEGASTENLEPEKVKLIQKTAFDYVNLNVDYYRLKLNTFEIKTETTSKHSYYVHCKSYFENADSVEWRFSDGHTFNIPNLSHKFRKAGTYSIILKVYDQCGVREMIRKVTFTPPPKPKRNRKSAPTTKIVDEKKKL